MKHLIWFAFVCNIIGKSRDQKLTLQQKTEWGERRWRGKMNVGGGDFGGLGQTGKTCRVEKKALAKNVRNLGWHFFISFPIQ
jgi:hypothetical protein